ncbi:hypothetical protein BO83DRAFT_4770 [Aspergillus eucalypticola CBS 122712]|uniref:Uncharacterized protein n=1 Tax=Aspergillus eucalypticola (strain CBS 122712 / IBT 29274) TaxID=1448314 RepID=A0A317WH09_ASPEC|nr:uncharacterized protein BO83DRAFT_4770 [Aspergillus eucalypticola CBS 122712]PWY85315.1 hypothetical protein BO83DRAFT_4770 [Aspergillus eucalypticola CBS 122712]
MEGGGDVFFVAAFPNLDYTVSMVWDDFLLTGLVRSRLARLGSQPPKCLIVFLAFCTSVLACPPWMKPARYKTGDS